VVDVSGILVCSPKGISRDFSVGNQEVT